MAVRIGVIGTGFGASVHVPGFRLVEGCEIVGIASGNPERARQAAEKFGIAQAFASWEELVADPSIDATSIATPPTLHHDIVMAAIAAGKSVLCEKPMAMNAHDGDEMLKAAQAAGIVHMVDFEFRELPVFQYAKHMISSGELGSLRHVNLHWSTASWGDPLRPWSWKSDQRLGGGVIDALATHALDYVSWLISPIARLTARATSVIPQRPDAQGIMRDSPCEDVCHILYTLEDGTAGSASVSNTDVCGSGHRLELFGDKKTLVLKNESWDYFHGFQAWQGALQDKELQLCDIPAAFQLQRTAEDSRVDPFARVAKRFIEAIAQGRTDVGPSFVDGVRAQRLVDAVRSSTESGEWVALSA